MIITYNKPDGTPAEYTLAGKQITMGRSPDADIIVLDERASRMHCGIRLWEGDYYVKDLQSKNGTWVNGQRVEMQKLGPGDRIRIGTTEYLMVDPDAPPVAKKMGTDTVNTNIQAEMDDGKGYNTILREIVEDAAPVVPAAGAVAGVAETVKKEVAGASEGLIEVSDDIKDASKNVTMPINLEETKKEDSAAPPKPKLKTVKKPTQLRLKKPPSSD